MTNYFSIGIDARICMGFEKNRGKTRFKNFLVYF